MVPIVYLKGFLGDQKFHQYMLWPKLIKISFTKKNSDLVALPVENPLAGGSGKQNQHGDSLAGIPKLASLWGGGKGSGFAGANTTPPTAQGPSTKCD